MPFSFEIALKIIHRNLWDRRNFKRQGIPSEKPDGAVTYGKGDKTTEFCWILKFTHLGFGIGEILKDKAQGCERNEAVDGYGDLSESDGNEVF